MTTTNGQSARRARTRAALLDAGRELLAKGRTAASIEEITRTAGVGFGSFHNHFPGGKDEFFEECVLDLLDAYAAWIREATGDLSDPAEVFARSFRLTGHLALERPGLLKPLLAQSFDVLFIERALRATAIEDLERGMASGRFLAAPVTMHLVAVGSLLLGLVSLIERQGIDGAMTIDDEALSASAASALRTLGLGAQDAMEVASRPLTPLDFPD